MTPNNSFTRALKDSVLLTENKCKKLGKELSIPWQAFERVLGMKYLLIRDYGLVDPAFVTPEKDASLNTIGVSVRSELDGSKISYGKRGLCIPVNWAEITDPSNGTEMIFFVEGATDVVASTVMGMFAVGRPSNEGGVEEIIKLQLANPGIKFIFVGENDAKPDGRWPGRDGARNSAQKVANGSQIPTYVAMPPEGIKDTRQILVDNHHEIYIEKTKTLSGVGAELKDHYLANLEVFSPVGNPAEEAAMAAAAAGFLPATSTTGAGTLAPPSHQSAAALATDAMGAIAASGYPVLDFTARDCHPKPDPFPRSDSDYSNRRLCPHQKVIVLSRMETELLTVLAPCKCWDCSVCGPNRRRQEKESDTEHFTEHEKNGGDLYASTINQSDWSKAKRSFETRRGKSLPLPDDAVISSDNKTADFTDPVTGEEKHVVLTRRRPDGGYRIAGPITNFGCYYSAIKRPDGSRFCISTEPPRTIGVNAVKVTAAEAIRLMSLEIDSAATPSYGKRLVTNSHGWPLIPDREPSAPSGWRVERNAGRLCTADDAHKILDGYGIEYKEIVSSGRYHKTILLLAKNVTSTQKELAIIDFGSGFYGTHKIDYDALFAREPNGNDPITDPIAAIFDDCFPSSA